MIIYYKSIFGSEYKKLEITSPNVTIAHVKYAICDTESFFKKNFDFGLRLFHGGRQLGDRESVNHGSHFDFRRCIKGSINYLRDYKYAFINTQLFFLFFIF